MSRCVIAHDQFYQAFPYISTASDKCWGEKAWVHGYLWLSYGSILAVLMMAAVHE